MQELIAQLKKSAHTVRPDRTFLSDWFLLQRVIAGLQGHIELSKLWCDPEAVGPWQDALRDVIDLRELLKIQEIGILQIYGLIAKRLAQIGALSRLEPSRIVEEVRKTYRFAELSRYCALPGLAKKLAEPEAGQMVQLRLRPTEPTCPFLKAGRLILRAVAKGAWEDHSWAAANSFAVGIEWATIPAGLLASLAFQRIWDHRCFLEPRLVAENEAVPFKSLLDEEKEAVEGAEKERRAAAERRAAIQKIMTEA